MNNEQFERRMEFIVEQQAQFATDIQQLKEIQSTEAQLWREKHENLTDAMTTVVGIVGKLADAQQRTDEHLSDLTTKQAETDDRLNVFITIVERFISRNGDSRRVKKKIAPARRKTKPQPKK
jgi:predicted  nucleic acid-binding Zn-ribbon protein